MHSFEETNTATQLLPKKSKDGLLCDHGLRLQLPLLTFHMTYWTSVTGRTLPVVIYCVEFFDFTRLRCLFSCIVSPGLHLGRKLTVKVSKVIALKSILLYWAILPLALTDTSMLYNSEIRLSLRVSTPVELAHLPSHWRKLTGTWQQEYPTESLQWSEGNFTLMPVYFDISKALWMGVTVSRVLI